MGNSGFLVGKSGSGSAVEAAAAVEKAKRCAAFPTAAWKSKRQLFHSYTQRRRRSKLKRKAKKERRLSEDAGLSAVRADFGNRFTMVCRARGTEIGQRAGSGTGLCKPS